MSNDYSKYPHSLRFTNKHRKSAERAAVLLGLEDWAQAVGFGIDLAEDYANACAEGDSEVIYCTPKIATMVESNPEFIAALCEEGVVEWLTPFVLAKSKQSNHPATDTTQS
jgi:hypothetical protein